MLKIKSAQAPQFTDVNVGRVFGYAQDVLRTQQNNETAQQLMEAEQEIIMNNPHISLQELMSMPIGQTLQTILGGDNWVFNPDQGIGQ